MNTPSFSDYTGGGENFAAGMPMEVIALALAIPLILGVLFVFKN